MEITSNRITATPRSKYHKYGIATSNGISNSSGSVNLDVSNFVKKTGETEQTIEGNVLATGDLIAYSTGQSVENYPIASSTALGTIKVGENLTITDDGTLNAEAGGVSNWNELQGKPTLLTDTNIQKWETNSHTHTNKAVLDTITADSIHTHSNKSYLDSINQNLSKTSDVNFGSVKATGDIIAYSTGQSTENYPIASSTALGCIKVGNNLSITNDGTLSAQAGGVTSWNELKDKPTTLAGYGITDAAKASDLTSHTGNTTVHITATERTNWSSAYSNSHTHSNKTTLDGISSTNVSNWNTAYTNNHTHSNKSVIDGITSTNITNWNDANSKKHTHSNKSYLDVINQNLATTSDVTFAGVKSTGDVIAYSTGSGDLTLPIASSTALGTIKVGSGLAITADGTLSATGTGSVGSINVSGSGNVVTGVSLTNGTIAFNKDLTALTTANYTTTLDSRYLKLSGGTLTGDISTSGALTISDYSKKLTIGQILAMKNSAGQTQDVIRCYDDGDSYAYGSELIIGAAGNTYIGGGESASALYGANGVNTGENLYLSADSNMYFYTNCQTIANRVGVILNTARAFYPDTNNTGTLGTSSNKWNNVYSTTFTGALYGNATTATTLQTARTINGTSFNGSANITTANWGTARNIYIADSDSTNIGAAVSVNGSANATLKLPSTIKASLTGNASTATTLQTARTIWGQTFNGSKNISGNMTGVGSITATGDIKTEGDVIAYSTGTASAPFKYWKPSVSADGNLSWTNSTSETVPDSVNIKGATPTIKCANGSDIATNGTPSVTASTSGTTTTFTFHQLKGATGATPTIKCANGTDISSVGEPSVTASTSGDTTTFTFHKLKGATGATGQGLTYQWDGTKVRFGTVNNGSTTWGSYVDLKGATGSASAWLQTKDKGTDRTLVTPANYPGNYLGAYAGRWGDYWQYFLYSSGTTAAIGWITTESTGTNYGVMSMARSGSTVNITASNGKFLDSSDARKKNVISECDINLNDIANIKNYHFRWKDEDDSAPIKCGVLAQDLLQNDKFIPFVSTYKDADGKEWYSVDYSGLGVAIASTGVKELYQLVKNQQAKIDELEQRLAIIESNNNTL